MTQHVVRNAIAPLGLKLMKRLGGSLSPKLSLLASNSDAPRVGLATALGWDSNDSRLVQQQQQQQQRQAVEYLD